MFVIRLLTIGFLVVNVSAFCMDKPVVVLKEQNGTERDDTLIVQSTHVSVSVFSKLKEAHLHNICIEEIVVPLTINFKDPLLDNLIAFSLTNSNITTFDLEIFLIHAPNVQSIDLSRNKQLSKLIFSEYYHKKLGYIGLNNTGLSTNRIAELKKLIKKTKDCSKPLIAAQSYTFNMPKVTHSSPELAKLLPYVASLYNE